MSPGRRPVPDPPTRAPKLPELVEDELVSGWRLHWEEDPRDPQRYETGKFRFDSPDGSYATTYVNRDPYAAFAEVYGDVRSIAPNQAERRFGSLTAKRPLRVIDLDCAETLAAFGLDLRISASTDYEWTMRWSKVLHGWYKHADGIRYLGRHATTKLNYCLFTKRCGKDLDYALEGKVVDLRPLVLRAADAYNLVPRLFEKRDPASPL